MTTATDIVLADAQGTPVNHTFVPIGPDSKGLFWFVDQSQANAIGYWRISVEIKQPAAAIRGGTSSNDERNYRYRLGLHEPVLENVSNSTVTGIEPAPTVAYVPRSFTEYVMPERTTLQNRKDLRKMTSNLSANALLAGIIENLQFLS
jgi:hypothetical protein